MDYKELLKHIRLFRTKANTNKLIVFVGAGVSCNVDNMPNWNDLIQEMAKSINYSRCSACKKKERNCAKTCKFKDSYSTDEYLKIPQYVYNKNRKLYNQVLRDNIQHDPTIDAPLSNAIVDLSPAHIITTNYDKLLENCQSAQKDNYEVVIGDRDLLNTIKNKYIIKMHGDIDNLDTIILKESDYLEYTQKHILIEMFIKSLLTDHTILFLGYSLNDYNVKLIISWINYIRSQNKALDKGTKFAYIALDEKKIASNQYKYFESNNIGVINLNQMPLIAEIPADLNNDIGKRLYSFLRVVENPSFENVFGTGLLLEDVSVFVKKYKYVDCKNLCSLLHLKQYRVEGYELFIHSDAEYDRLMALLNYGDANALNLQQLFFNAGIYYIRLISVYTDRREDYKIAATGITLLNDQAFSSYLSNDYLKLSAMAAVNSETNPINSCFYLSLIKDYVQLVFDWHSGINYDELSKEDKVRYLFNDAVLEARKTYRHSNQRISKYIDGLADIRTKKMFSLYTDIFEGNNKRLRELGVSLEKLKEQYYNSKHTFLGCSSLSELFKVRRIAVEQYLFYFSNGLMFKGFSDLKKILKHYIEAIVCTNGNFTDSTTGALGIRSIKERYKIDAIDFDMATKFVSVKELRNLLQDYSVGTFAVTREMVEHAIVCFDNLADYIIGHGIYNRFYDAPSQWVNCASMLCHFPLDDNQKLSIRESINKVFANDDFVKFFFSTDFPDFGTSTRVLHDLLKIIPKSFDLEAVGRVFRCDDFMSFYINSDVRRLQSILSYFIDDEKFETIDQKLYSIIMSFEERERVAVLRLLYKHLNTSQYLCEYKNFVRDSIGLLDSDDIFDFAFDGWLEITDDYRKEMLSRAIHLYRQQQETKVHTCPDPLQSQLELIYILYLTEKVSDIECLREIIDASDFLQFFLDPDNFDYTKIDFSNYMWENIARRERFMSVILAHKEDVLPKLRLRVETDQATETERKILYGYMIDKSELL